MPGDQMSIYEFEGHRPSLPGDDPYYIAPSAEVIGKVTIGKLSSVWFNAVIRGDNDPITIGEETSIQDNCVLHTDPGFPISIGNRVTVGHLAMLHGCRIGDGSLIGEGKEIPDNSMVLGAPGRVVKTLGPEAEAMLAKAAATYVDKVHRYARQNGLKLIES
jgi:carbonic anhydrase/acetyltransferase-like protein (isoleucine patch superfamily)